MKSKRGGQDSEEDDEEENEDEEAAVVIAKNRARYPQLLPESPAMTTRIDRETIREFWLDLGEKERRELVRVEREAMLRKLREEQKYACTCNVCVRRRYAEGLVKLKREWHENAMLNMSGKGNAHVRMT